jgi:tetratricopeptide (TPR) repeat protein
MLALASPLSAAEQWKPFLEGLRERGYYDTAIEYLDSMADNPRCPADLKQVLDYEAGITLMEGAHGESSPQTRQRALDLAQTRFQKFLAEHPDHPLASPATSDLANVLTERGRLRKWESDQPGVASEQQKKLLAESRDFFTQAQTALGEAEAHYITLLKKMRAEGEKGKVTPEQQQARYDLVRTKLYRADAAYEVAMTYPPKSSSRQEKLEEAARLYNAIYDAYFVRWEEKMPRGLLARLKEGRCRQLLRRNVQAMAIYDEVREKAKSSRVPRELANMAAVWSLEALTAPEVGKYDHAIELYNEWTKTARPNDLAGRDGAAVKYFAAMAYFEKAKKVPEGNTDRATLLSEAQQLFRQVAGLKTAYYREARKTLLDPLFAASKAARGAPATFAEARDRAAEAWTRYQTAFEKKAVAQGEGRTADRAECEREVARAVADGIKCCRTALGMATPETPADELNALRYYQAWLHFENGDSYEAIVLGDFLANRYPKSEVAAGAALIAMQAYARLYRESPEGEEKEFARQRMMKAAERIVARWPDRPEAGRTWLTLIQQAAVFNQDMDAALDYLERVPKNSSQRGQAELIIGEAYWRQWLKAKEQDEAKRPDVKTLDTLAERAEKHLASGIQRRVADGRIDEVLVMAEYALARLYADQGRPEKTVEVLDEPTAGLMTLVRAGKLPAKAAAYESAIYRTALEAYVAGQSLEKAEAVMDLLEKNVAEKGDADAAKQLTAVYIGLSRKLQESLELLRAQQRTDEVLKVAGGFELFLNRIAQRKQGNTFGSLVWVAGTFVDMAERFDTHGSNLSPEARKYYQNAAAAYREILDRCEKDPKFATSAGAVTGVNIRLARCLRRLGEYDKAMDLVVKVLARRNRIVEGQIEAALTYQDWARLPRNAKMYLSAIDGGKRAKNKRGQIVNIVWGWRKLGNIVLRSRSPKRLALFHEARYNLAKCRFFYAVTLSGAEKKEVLAQAEKEIRDTQLLSPKMGGPEWKGRYDTLLKKIQSVQGKSPVGLKTNSKSRKQ